MRLCEVGETNLGKLSATSFPYSRCLIKRKRGKETEGSRRVVDEGCSKILGSLYTISCLLNSIRV